jgi:DNA-binding NtrC family response regulator
VEVFENTHDGGSERQRKSRPPAVLIVSDAREAAEAFAEAYRRRGFHVLTVDSARRGKRVAAQLDERLTVLVVDVGLPGDDPEELAAALLAQNPGLSVALVPATSWVASRAGNRFKRKRHRGNGAKWSS